MENSKLDTDSERDIIRFSGIYPKKEVLLIARLSPGAGVTRRKGSVGL